MFINDEHYDSMVKWTFEFSNRLFNSGDSFVKLIELFANTKKPLPYSFVTGNLYLGDPTKLKNFKCVEFFNSKPNTASLAVRIYVDNKLVIESMVTPSKNASAHSKINLPTGKRRGYAICLEVVGIDNVSVIEYTFE